MQITVGLGTWNRANLLDSTLTSLAKVKIPPGVRWRVIVANNNSTDDTEAVLDRHAGRLPLERLFVAAQGKSHALNAIAERLEGDLVLWTDDDIQFDAHWIAAYVDAARTWHQAAFFGGRISPLFLEDEPSWLRPTWEYIRGPLGERALGDAPFAFDAVELPYGANFAVRVDIQKRYRFDVELGRRGELMFAGEETALMRQWIAEGRDGMWVPQSLVHHVVTPDRLEIDSLRRIFYGVGIMQMSPHAMEPFPRRFLLGTKFLLHVYADRFKSLFHPCAMSPCGWMKYLKRISQNAGRVEALWHDVPEWLKPAILRKLKRRQNQPRYTEPVSHTAIETQRLHLPVRQGGRAA